MIFFSGIDVDIDVEKHRRDETDEKAKEGEDGEQKGKGRGRGRARGCGNGRRFRSGPPCGAPGPWGMWGWMGGCPMGPMGPQQGRCKRNGAGGGPCPGKRGKQNAEPQNTGTAGQAQDKAPEKAKEQQEPVNLMDVSENADSQRSKSPQRMVS